MLVPDDHIKAYFDGGCTKFGIMTVCVVIIHQDTAYVHSGIVGRGCSLQAEWTASLNAVYLSKERLPGCSLELVGDCLAVLETVSGAIAPKNPISIAHQQSFNALMNDLSSVSYDWVRRDNNLAGRFLDGGAGAWFQHGLFMIENVYEIVMLPLPQSLGLQSCGDSPRQNATT